MQQKIVKPYSEKERNNLGNEEYLKIEREFHDKYSEHLNWSAPVNDNYSYDRNEFGKPVEDYYKQKLGNVKGKKILDIGSGYGNTALNLAKQGAIVYSIDIAPKLIEGCKERAKLNNLNVDFRVMDACNLEYSDETFDIITGFRVIHHLPDLKKFYTESYRCLKKGGFLLIVEPQKNNPFVEFGRRFIKNKEDSRTPTEHPLISKDIKDLKQIFGNLEEKQFEFKCNISCIFKK